ncbi:MAG TPA: phosphoribosylaminoimidazolesuccinocarboxamide synthase [bacterium (Candidatus Stahlbacteria)]|nr:phosphoribosylaminoimidazolesuccinocarboxamide synthase [Candidatus Stahlbacteria bacterium]
MDKVLLTTNLKDVKLFKRGKVRDIYELDDKLLIVATDRISAFDVVLPNGIPKKGKILNKLSEFWFNFTKYMIKNHFITTELPVILERYKEVLLDRAMLVKKAKPIEVECIVRGYLSGSAWKEYREDRTLCGIRLPKGLRESEKLSEPIFTPTTKVLTGHDISITEKEMQNMIGGELTQKLKTISIEIYNTASDYALKRGIIIADTKFEFGISDHELILIDELLTPDSSRFWPKDEYEVGRSQRSFDKQFVRDYLEEIGWNKTPPAPELPKEVIEKTTEKYLEVYDRLVGEKL